MNKSIVIIALCGLAALAAFGCKSKPSATKVVVYAAAGLHGPIGEVTAEFNATIKPAELSIDYAGTGQLLGKLKTASAPEYRPDVFIAAEESYAKKAVDQGLADRTEVWGYNVPVLVVSNSSTIAIEKLADLGKAGVKVSLGENRGPAIGIVSDKLLDQAGLGDVAKAAVRCSTVEEVANNVKLGHADAAIIWEMTARQPGNADKMKIIPIPDAPRVAIVLCRVAKCPHPAQADAFIKFLTTSPSARAAMVRHSILPATTQPVTGAQP
ncbi:MAG: substrate-binding domain-containing protein [Phycisphaerae bacterium]|nr:substrate-binding domain-containing protein [Phycisphaerae bacterium]